MRQLVASLSMPILFTDRSLIKTTKQEREIDFLIESSMKRDGRKFDHKPLALRYQSEADLLR